MNSSLCFTLVVMLLVVYQTEAGYNSYIDDLIAESKDIYGTKHIDSACIIGLDGGEKWTTDSHANALKISKTEAATIASAFKKQDFSTFQSNGVYIAGVKYSFWREKDGVVQASKKYFGAISMQASKTAIVIAHIIEGGQHGRGNKAVGVIVDDLYSSGD